MAYVQRNRLMRPSWEPENLDSFKKFFWAYLLEPVVIAVCQALHVQFDLFCSVLAEV